MRDFYEFYEGIRFSPEFIIYRMMDWWPIMDSIAQYGHTVYALAVIWTGLFLQLNALSGFNVFCICIFYFLVVQRMRQRQT
jgi:hypothetical protein